MYRAKNTARVIRLLLPAILIGVLVVDAICAYQAPAIHAESVLGTETAQAAATAPKLELTEQKKEEKKQPEGTAAPLDVADESTEWKDGVYTGSAKGYGGTITVRVTIRDGKIAGIEIVSAAGEDEPYFGKAKSVTGTIIKRQSTNVDAISGATYSSNGIILAVRNALAKASGKPAKATKAKKGKPEKSKGEPRNKNASKSLPPAVVTGEWVDGTYTGTGEGFGGKMTVTVTVQDGKIIDITITKHQDDKEYLDKATASVIPAILKKQGTDVDTVSGATYSSIGILEAVGDALKKAVQTAKGESAGNEVQEQEPEEQNQPQNQVEEQVSRKQIDQTVKVYADASRQFADYDLLVTYVIEEGQIVDIINVKQRYREPTNDSYVKAALRGILKQIDTNPTLEELDTVSGATCTFDAVVGGGRKVLQENN